MSETMSRIKERVYGALCAPFEAANLFATDTEGLAKLAQLVDTVLKGTQAICEHFNAGINFAGTVALTACLKSTSSVISGLGVFGTLFTWVCPTGPGKKPFWLEGKKNWKQVVTDTKTWSKIFTTGAQCIGFLKFLNGLGIIRLGRVATETVGRVPILGLVSDTFVVISSVFDIAYNIKENVKEVPAYLQASKKKRLWKGVAEAISAQESTEAENDALQAKKMVITDRFARHCKAKEEHYLGIIEKKDGTAGLEYKKNHRKIIALSGRLTANGKIDCSTSLNDFLHAIREYNHGTLKLVPKEGEAIDKHKERLKKEKLKELNEVKGSFEAFITAAKALYLDPDENPIDSKDARRLKKEVESYEKAFKQYIKWKGRTTGQEGYGNNDLELSVNLSQYCQDKVVRAAGKNEAALQKKREEIANLGASDDGKFRLPWKKTTKEKIEVLQKGADQLAKTSAIFTRLQATPQTGAVRFIGHRYELFKADKAAHMHKLIKSWLSIAYDVAKIAIVVLALVGLAAAIGSPIGWVIGMLILSLGVCSIGITKYLYDNFVVKKDAAKRPVLSGENL